MLGSDPNAQMAAYDMASVRKYILFSATAGVAKIFPPKLFLARTVSVLSTWMIVTTPGTEATTILSPAAMGEAMYCLWRIFCYHSSPKISLWAS